ncbi:AlbA family DNA-binding domain-containing protein [Candidatus Marithrix sp. Canyon 246]|nr:ATP-binding protein [Candidatus Marithrix sp. Canyon 246]
MSKEIRELLYQIRLGEDSSIEFKQLIFKANKIQAPNKKSLADEIAAFANSTEGRIILGVDYIEKSLFVHQSSNGYFYRYGSAKRQMPPDFLARLFQQRSQVRIIYFDEQAVPNTIFSDLEPELYRRFLPENEQSERTKLEKMHLLTS